jgi:hypothetical protein
MNWDDVYLVTDKLKIVSDAEVDELETRLGVTMPVGYREFMTQLGDGNYCGYVYVLTPSYVEEPAKKWKSLDATRSNLGWHEDLLTPELVLQCIEIAHTLDGDEIVFHPSEPNKIYILPHYDHEIYLAGSTLKEALDWIFTANTLISATDDFWYFESDINRKLIKMLMNIEAKTFAEIREFLTGLQIHQHKYVIEDDEDSEDFLELIVRQIHSRLAVVVIPEREIQLIINFDVAEEYSPFLTALIEKLKAFGFYPTEKNTIIS